MRPNQKVGDLSFKDLTTRLAAEMKPNPADTAKTPAKENETKAVGEAAPAKSEIS